jgi:hypothetical protein
MNLSYRIAPRDKKASVSWPAVLAGMEGETCQLGTEMNTGTPVTSRESSWSPCSSALPTTHVSEVPQFWISLLLWKTGAPKGPVSDSPGPVCFRLLGSLKQGLPRTRVLGGFSNKPEKVSLPLTLMNAKGSRDPGLLKMCTRLLSEEIPRTFSSWGLLGLLVPFPLIPSHSPCLSFPLGLTLKIPAMWHRPPCGTRMCFLALERLPFRIRYFAFWKEITTPPSSYPSTGLLVSLFALRISSGSGATTSLMVPHRPWVWQWVNKGFIPYCYGDATVWACVLKAHVWEAWSSRWWCSDNGSLRGVRDKVIGSIMSGRN